MRIPGTGSGPRCRSGKRKRKPSSVRRSLEYLCVARLRRRRLLAFLSRYGFNNTFEALLQETKVFFSVAHLQRLARLGQWDKAIAYVSRFVPSVNFLGEEGRLLFGFLNLHKIIHSIAIGTPEGAAMAQVYQRDVMEHPNPGLGIVKLTYMLSALHRSEQIRNSVNWHLVRYKAAEIAKDLIARTPEFNDLVRLPNCRDKPRNIIPIRSCSSHPRHHMKKIVGQIPPSDLAKFYLQKKKSLLSVSHSEGSSLVSGLSCSATALLANIIDISVRAGMNQVVQDEDSYNKAFSTCKRASSASCNLSMMEVSFSAKRKQVRHTLEYPCVSRFRHRLLLAFLRCRCSASTFKAFLHETDVFFSIEHLQRLVLLAQWDNAIKYVSRFVPSVHMLGSEGVVFYNFLEVHKTLHSIAAGEPQGALIAEYYERNLKNFAISNRGTVKLTLMLSAMLRRQDLRNSVNWHLVRYKAAKIAKGLIARTPEFSDLLRLPNCRGKPQKILPLGSCSHQRHHMKEIGRAPASDIAKFYLQNKRSRPSSSHCEGNSVVSGLSHKESTWQEDLADAIDESMQAGICRVFLQGHSFEDSRNEGLKHTEVSFARNNPKRPLTTVCQEFNSKRQRISGELGQLGRSSGIATLPLRILQSF